MVAIAVSVCCGCWCSDEDDSESSGAEESNKDSTVSECISVTEITLRWAALCMFLMRHTFGVDAVCWVAEKASAL